jgi:hypothetical protein
MGVRPGSDAGTAVVGLGEAGAGRGDSSGVKGVVGDHAAFHKGKAVGEGGPPYSPESCGAVFEEVRRWVEGRRYESIEDKQTAMEGVLRRLEAEERVLSLVGWRYIREAFRALTFRDGISV